jgi:hypothetical protein
MRQSATAVPCQVPMRANMRSPFLRGSIGTDY